ncbi:hypothetical protein RJ639_030241 [Escallonia herrerae]|uniref:cysteine dioxygenase n=1 Tax=Escallonia herrerae TaxID=1293975 RepID=A0AA88WYJ9_9ASTE|nr:hypothetical protein RJ639_030241 [Escallonia herrerae]
MKTERIALASDRKSKEEARKGRRRQRRPSPVQTLYNICKEVFADCGPGIVPSPAGTERLKVTLDKMTKADVGLRRNMPFFRAQESEGLPKITYLHIHECDKFSIGIFCLPPSGVIPLHNHPGMTVFSKLLFGTMHKKSYDWVDDGLCKKAMHVSSSNGSAANPAEVRLAKVKVDADFTAPCNTSVLYPADGGNLHSFRAVTPCAVLDVLGPPYCDPEGRHCAYYLDFPFTNLSVDGLSVPEEEREGYAWLQEKDTPEGLAVDGALYNGPRIVVK